jgi:pyruvate dehydrogenase E2 component (dihydrolipoamide acetyltransferase)
MAIEHEIKIPDIGGADHVDVIELLVKEGDTVTKETPLVTLESDKASMEIPSPMAGVVRAIRIKVGDKVSEGDLILMLAPDEASVVPLSSPTPTLVAPEAPAETSLKPTPEPVPERAPSVAEPSLSKTFSAGPAVRRLAHQLGVELAQVHGSGRKSRVSKEDLEKYVKDKLANLGNHHGLSVSAAPSIDFSQFGPIDHKPLNKIKRITGANVHRAWVTIPHVTQFDEADITTLDAFRQSESKRIEARGYKLTLLAFVCKVVSKALAEFPSFNASLDASGEQLILKQYYHVGIAVETPNGLVVPVIRNVNQLSVGEIAQEMARLSLKAREKGLMPNDMSGGCFTISSLGGIGGTAFTPIVNSPEVAILGLSRSQIKPKYIDGAFVPRLMLPLSLSYDHRVIDGAEAARFTCFLSDGLSDIRRILI